MNIFSFTLYTVAGDFTEAMKCYLELGSITSSFFSRPVASSVWDDKVFIVLTKSSFFISFNILLRVKCLV